MPPLLADFTHARPCKPKCEKYLTLPKPAKAIDENDSPNIFLQSKNKIELTD